jgi:glycosyltransferase involved in cell wall biosynthesis
MMRSPMHDNMAVAFINSFPGPSLGGGEVQLLALLRGLLAAGLRPTVVCAAGSALEREIMALEGVEVVPVDFALRSLPSLVSTVAARLEGMQIVQGTGFLTNLIARRVGARNHAAVVNLVQVVPGAALLDGGSRVTSAVRTLIDRASRRSVSRFVAVSEAVETELIADKVAASRITVIPNGVEILQLRRAASSALGPKPDEARARVGFVGRLEQIKGCEFFIRAAALLAADHPSVSFVVAGTGSRERVLRMMAADLGIADRVEFLGHVESVAPLLAALDVVVVPSLSEASGLTAIEALALGVPVVASRVGGLPDVVVHEETGLLVAPGDSEGIARAVARLLGDPALVQTLAAAGARWVEERFTMERMIDGYLRLYGSLVPDA